MSDNRNKSNKTQKNTQLQQISEVFVSINNIRKYVFSDYLVLLFLAITLIVLVVAAGHSVGLLSFANTRSNLVENGSFENGFYKYAPKLGIQCPNVESSDNLNQDESVYTCDYGLVASSWHVIGSRYLLQKYKIDSSTKTDKEVSQLIDVSSHDMGIKQTISLKSNKTYLFSVDVLIKEGGVKFIAESEDKHKIMGYSESRDKNNEWQNLSFIVNTSDNDNHVDLKIVSLDDGHNLFNIDNLTVIEEKQPNSSNPDQFECGAAGFDDINGTRKRAIEIQRVIEGVDNKNDGEEQLPNEYYPLKQINYKRFKVFIYIPKELEDKLPHILEETQKTVNKTVEFYNENSIKLVQDGDIEVIKSDFSFDSCNPNGDYFKDSCKDLRRKFAKATVNMAKSMAVRYKVFSTMPVVISPVSELPDGVVGQYIPNEKDWWASIAIFGVVAPGSDIIGNERYDLTDNFHALAHEFGHAMGLNHSFLPSIMGGYFGPNVSYILFDNMYYPEKYVACNSPLNRNDHAICEHFTKPISNSVKSAEINGKLFCINLLNKKTINGHIELLPTLSGGRDKEVRISLDNNRFSAISDLDFGNEIYKLKVYDSDLNRYIKLDDENNFLYTFVVNQLDYTNPYVCSEYGYSCMSLKDWTIPISDSTYCGDGINVNRIGGRFFCSDGAFSKFKDKMSVSVFDKNSNEISSRYYLDDGNFEVALSKTINNISDLPLFIKLYYQGDNILNGYSITVNNGVFESYSIRKSKIYSSNSLLNLELPIEVCNKVAVVDGTFSCKTNYNEYRPMKNITFDLMDNSGNYLGTIQTDDTGKFSIDKLYFNWGGDRYVLSMSNESGLTLYTFKLLNNKLVFDWLSGNGSNIVSGKTYWLVSDKFLRYSPSVDVVVDECPSEPLTGDATMSGRLECGSLHKIKFDKDISINIYDIAGNKIAESSVDEFGKYVLHISELNENSYPLFMNIFYGQDFVDSYQFTLYNNGSVAIVDPIKHDTSLVTDLNNVNLPFYGCPFISKLSGSVYCMNDSNNKIEIPLNKAKLFTQSDGIDIYVGDAQVYDNKFETNDLYRQKNIDPSQLKAKYKLYIEENNNKKLSGTIDFNVNVNDQSIEYANIPTYMNVSTSKSYVSLSDGILKYEPEVEIVFSSCNLERANTGVLLSGQIKCPNSTILFPFKPEPNGYAQVEFRQLVIDPPLDMVARSQKIYPFSNGYFADFPISFDPGSMQDTLQFKLYNSNGGLANYGKDIYYIKYNGDGTVTLTDSETKSTKTFQHDDINVELSTCDTSLTCSEGQSLGDQILNAISFGILGNEQCDDNSTAPNVTFSADKTVVYRNTDQVRLSWNSSNVSGCYASGDWFGKKNISGYEVVGPFNALGDKIFTLSCFDANNKVVNKSITIRVLNNSTTIKGTLYCQNVGTPPTGTNIQVRDENQNVIGQTNVVVDGGQSANFAISTNNVNLMDGRMYNIRPTGFGPNTGGTYECVQKNPRTNELWAKRNMPTTGGSCIIPENPRMCPPDLGDNSGECWQVIDPNNIVITATSCGGQGGDYAEWLDYCDRGEHMNCLNLSENPPSIKEAKIVKGSDGRKYVEICLDSRYANAKYDKGFKIYVDKGIEYLPRDQDHYWREGRGAPINEDFYTGRKGTYVTKQDRICTRTSGGEYSIPLEKLREIDRVRGGNDGIVVFNIAAGADRGYRQKKTCKIEGLTLNIGESDYADCSQITLANLKANLIQKLGPSPSGKIQLTWNYQGPTDGIKATIDRYEFYNNQYWTTTNYFPTKILDNINRNSYIDTTVFTNKRYRYQIHVYTNCSNSIFSTSNEVRLFSPQAFIGHVVSGSECKISGWARDQDVPDEPIDIHVYSDGDYKNGTFVKSSSADIYREDLKNVFGGSKYANHGFDIDLTQLRDGNCHPLFLYALNKKDTEGHVIKLPRGNDNAFICDQYQAWNDIPDSWKGANAVIQCSKPETTAEKVGVLLDTMVTTVENALVKPIGEDDVNIEDTNDFQNISPIEELDYDGIESTN